MPIFYGPFREIIYRSVDYENQEAGLESKYQDLPYGQRVYLGPTQPSVTRPHRRLGAPLAASPTRTTKKASPAASERVGGRPSSAHGRRKQTSVSARGKCPKGHYWSYKLKKCVPSNFN